MKWIKASERVPEDWENAIARIIDGGKVIVKDVLGIIKQSPDTFDLHGIEWLDESAEEGNVLQSEQLKIFANWLQGRIWQDNGEKDFQDFVEEFQSKQI